MALIRSIKAPAGQFLPGGVVGIADNGEACGELQVWIERGILIDKRELDIMEPGGVFVFRECGATIVAKVPRHAWVMR